MGTRIRFFGWVPDQPGQDPGRRCRRKGTGAKGSAGQEKEGGAQSLVGTIQGSFRGFPSKNIKTDALSQQPQLIPSLPLLRMLSGLRSSSEKGDRKYRRSS